MREFLSEIDRIVETISKNENERRDLCSAVKKLRPSENVVSDEALVEGELVKKIPKSELGKIVLAAVDGGLISKSFHGIDILLLRAVGVIFGYDNGRLASYNYHPSPVVEPVPRVYHEPLHEVELEASINMERQRSEFSRAKEVVDKFKPDIMFMHGSIVPQYTNVPNKESPIGKIFSEMISSYTELFDACESSVVVLAGIIEDSRGSRFCDILRSVVNSEQGANSGEILRKTNDSVLLNHLLDFGERTAVFNYSSSPHNNIILRQLGKHCDRVNSFYLKNAELDRPIRVDFLCPKGSPSEIADRMSSVLVALSKNSMYAIPPMIVEADQRAKLSDDDLNLFYSALAGKLGGIRSLEELRRAQRPF